MSRAIANIFIIFIIAFTVSGVPINTELLNISLTLPSSTDNSQSEAVKQVDYTQLAYQAQEDQYWYNPDEWVVKFIGDRSIDQDVTTAIIDELSLEIYTLTDNETTQIIKRFQFSNLNSIMDVTTNADVLSLHLHISKDTLELDKGHYIAKLIGKGNHIQESFSATQHITYTNAITYLAPADSAKSGYAYRTLYFTDISKNHLIPVSRQVKTKGNRIREALNALRDGPIADSGLNETSTAPYVPVARYSRSKKLVQLKTRGALNNDFIQTEEDTYLMIHALINTMTDLTDVDSIKFYVDDKDTTPINGYDISQPYTDMTSVMTYYSLDATNNRAYLVPVSSVANNPDLLFAELKSKDLNNADLFSTVPGFVSLKNWTLENGLLQLEFDANIAKAYDNDATYQRLMMDCIVYSMISLPDVRKIQISISDYSDASYGGYTLNEAFTPVPFVNPETE